MNEKGNINKPQIDKSNRKCTGLFLQFDNGDMVDVKELPKAEYDKFLESMNDLRIAYISMNSSR